MECLHFAETTEPRPQWRHSSRMQADSPAAPELVRS
jgi:hypothetical protein